MSPLRKLFYMNDNHYTLRQMRDYVYGERSSDTNWEATKEKWHVDEKWLVEQFNKRPRPLPPYNRLPMAKKEDL